MSQYFEWDAAKYSIHVPKMDADHQRIIDGMNKLHTLYSAKAPVVQLSNALNDLAKVTVAHFSAEETYMASIQFPGLAQHKIIHKNLLEQINAHKAKFDASGKLTDDFFAFLKTWLKSHICGIDVKYGEHAKAA